MNWPTNMFWLAVAIALTLGVSFLCSLMEALILSTTVTEVEALKRDRPIRGRHLEDLKTGIEETISTILTLNTIANTLGSIVIGGLATKLYGDAILGIMSAAMTLGILIFSEVIPKNLGVVYRRQLQPHVVIPLRAMRGFLRPITYLCNFVVRLVMPRATAGHDSEEEILLLAEKGAKEGSLTLSESHLIANALSLDEIRVWEIMTPRTVIMALGRDLTISEVFRQHPNVPFARIPVFTENLDKIVGITRRRDLLKAKANDQDELTVGSLMQEVHFIPDTVTGANALQAFLKHHQQLLVVVDEFGSTAGVVTMEDVIEHLLGREIFEKDDMAIDMRELARTKLKQSRLKSLNPPRPKP